jgi:hypothetical protein
MSRSKSSKLAILAAIGLLGIGTSAVQASYIYGSFSGTVDSGDDVQNIFGLGIGADLVGQPITGTLEFDPVAFESRGSNGTTTLSVLGGPVFGLPIMQPPAEVTETINGKTLTSIGIGASSAFVFQNNPVFNAGDTTGFGIAVSDLSNLNGTIVDYAKTDSPDTIISDVNDISALKFNNINGDDINGGGFPYGGEIFLGGGGAGPVILFSVTSMTVGVPEPPTWSIMLFGFVTLGFARYRRVAP